MITISLFFCREVESLTNLINILKTTEHGGFPVVSSSDKLTGLITRFQLMTLLCKGVIRDALESDQVIDLQVIKKAIIQKTFFSCHWHNLHTYTKSRGNTQKTCPYIRGKVRRFLWLMQDSKTID